MNALKAILIVIIFGLGGFAWKTLMDKQAVEADFARLEASQMQALKDKQAETQKALAAQAEQHQRAIQQLSADHEAKLDELRAAQREKMAQAYTEFENIFEGNKKTIDYINALEGKVKAGQDLSKMEVEKLAVITTGLSYLQKQYQKPLQEFGELESYFATQASRQPEKPSSRFRFFKRMFSRNFRESEKEFYREQGAQAAMEEAQTKFTTVYASAQKSMAAVGLDAEKQVANLYQFIEEKDAANKDDLTELFIKARQALQTHQDVLSFEPEQLPGPADTPRP